MTPSGLQRVLTGGRVLVGGTTLVAPGLAARAFGIDPLANPAAAYVGRLFGVRAVLMAVLLADSAGAERRRQLRAGVVVDVIDALAALAAGRAGQLGRRAATGAFAAAVFEASLGVHLLREDDALSAGRERSPR